MALKAVGFDIDGTLYQERRAKERSILFMISNLGVVRAFIKTRRIMRESNRVTDSDELEIFAQKLHCDRESSKFIRDSIIYRKWEECFRNVPVYPGVLDALLRLKDAGLKLAVLSDFPVGNKLKYFGLDDVFDVTLGFPESKRLKPDSEPFGIMAEKLCVNAEDILYIGNRLEYDVRGAENSGMRGALVGIDKRHVPSDVTVYSNYQHLADSILSEVTR